MNRRTFLESTASAGLAAALPAASQARFPMGLNTYCLRAQREHMERSIHYARKALDLGVKGR